MLSALFLSPNHLRLRGIVAACLVVLIWSGWIVSSRWGLTSNIAAIDLTWLRFTTAAIITLPLVVKYNWRKLPVGKALVVAFGCGFPYVWFAYLGLQYTPSANASVLINGLLPVVTSLIALSFLGGKFTKPLLFLIVVVSLSNIIIAGAEAEFSFRYIAGICFLLTATVIISVYMSVVKTWNISIGDIMVWVPIINAIFIAPFWLVYSDGISAIQKIPTGELLFHVVYQGLIVSVIALFLFSFSIKTIGALSSSIFMAFVPTTTALLAFVVISERPSPSQWIAITMCTFGLVGYSILNRLYSEKGTEKVGRVANRT